MATKRVCKEEKSIWEAYADEQYKNLQIEIDNYSYLDDYRNKFEGFWKKYEPKNSTDTGNQKTIESN